MPLQWLLSMTITMTLRPVVQFCFFCPNHPGSEARPPAPLLCPSIHIYNTFHSTPVVLWLIYTAPNWPFQMCPTARGEWGKFTARNQKYATLWNMGFFMAWFELHIRNSGAVQWLFTIWEREKAVQRPSGAIFHSPIRRSHRWLKALQAAANCRACWSHSKERDVFLWERRSLRTHWHWKSWHKFPWWMQRKKSSPTFPSSSHL